MGDSWVDLQDTNEVFHESAITVGKEMTSTDDVLPARIRGTFVPLKTTLETRSREKIGKVYVTGVPAKLASTVLNLIRKLIPDDGGIDLQHLRRFAKPKDLPPHVHALLTKPPFSTSPPTSTTTPNPDPIPSPSQAELFLIAGPTSSISSTEMTTSLKSVLQDVHLFEIDVPLLSPTSQEQASLWSTKYWPTVYKKINPFGPHPSILERAEEEMKGEVESYMGLAERVAAESEVEGRGERIGVVVVERKEGKGRVIAVAGDGRWDGMVRPRSKTGSGNVFAHAVMRAIGMVARGLKARANEDTAAVAAGEAMSPSSLEDQSKPFESAPASRDTKPSAEIFKDTPVCRLEEQHYDPSGNATGYLCHELEIYCTHEPCVMCSMAIVHSRFGRIVFKRRMSETGGMCADGGLGHGLFWRKELNWTLLGWQWVCEGEEMRRGGGEGERYLHA